MKLILVADPDPAVSQWLNAHLRFAGVELLNTGRSDALQTALDTRPDLVVADAEPPDWFGFSLAQHLREKAPEIPLLLVSASTEAWVQETARVLHARALVHKPVSAENLLPVVHDLLGLPPFVPATENAATPPPGSAPPPAMPRPERPAPATPIATPPPSPPASDAAKASPPAAAPIPPAAQPSLTGKVLIVEDDRHIAKALAVRLRSAGLEVLMAGDALSGLDMAVRQQPDLVLLDIGLPAGSGLKVAERIQTLLPKLTPIIFLTASRQPGLREQALRLDPVDYFEKPYDADKLLEAIQRALASRV